MTARHAAPVTRSVAFSLYGDPGQRGIAITAWVPSDPAAATITFRSGTCYEEWRVGRRLLAGIAASVIPYGAGNVRGHRDGDRYVRLVLDSPDGHAELRLDRADVDGFVTAVRNEMPVAAESRAIQAAITWDAFDRVDAGRSM